MKQCSTCKAEKPESEFYFDRRKNYRTARCDACRSASKQRYVEANREKTAADNLRWQRENKDRTKAAQERWKEKNPGEAGKRALEWYHKNRETAKDRESARRQKQKLQVFEGYGGAKCACCGEEIVGFLTMDHINNDGASHRKEVEGRLLYVWLIKNNFPKGFQVLCMNCNWGRSKHNGICPHKLSEGPTTRA